MLKPHEMVSPVLSAIESTMSIIKSTPPIKIRRGSGPLAPVLVLALLGVFSAVTSGQEFAAEGWWSGAISTPAGSLTIAIRLQRGDAGVWSGVIDIPQQGAKAVPLGDVAVADRSVAFRIMGAPGNPAIRLTASVDGQRLAGSLTQGGATLPVSLTRGVAKAAESPRGRPQTPIPPFPYVDEQVVFTNERAAIALAGTLTLPSGTAPFPAVLLITGSGQQDRDQTLFGHKPFAVWADQLTRRGVAVLRVDDRGMGGSASGPASPTSRDFADDVRAAVRFLRTRSDIDPKQVGLLGHSEGAMLASMVAADSDAAFVVMLAGPGVPGEQLLYTQAAQLFRGQGVSEAVVAWDRLIREKAFAVLKAEPLNAPDSAARDKVLAEVDSLKPPAGNPSAGRQLAQALFTQGSQPWFKFFLAYDPRPDLAKVRCPVLAIGGERDLQVTASENLDQIARALRSAGNSDVTTKVMPGLNHLFQTAKTGLPSEYETIEETLAPAVLTLVSDWIVKHIPNR